MQKNNTKIKIAKQIERKIAFCNECSLLFVEMKAKKLWSTKKKNKQNNKTYRFVPEDLYSDGKPNKDAKTSSNVAEPLCEGRSV